MALGEPGDLVLFAFPQTDLQTGKRRPALLIAKVPGDYDDWLVCMLSSQIDREIPGVDELISNSDPDFDGSGLKSDTVICVTRLAVVSGSIFSGSIGRVGPERLARIRSRLTQWILES